MNNISTLSPFQHCPKLQELYLRKNKIGDLREVVHLSRLPQLKVLWLSENPVSELPLYRETVLKLLPQLKKLDNQLVTPEEVGRASQMDLGYLEDTIEEEQDYHYEQ